MVLGTSRANNNLIIKSQDFKLDIGKRLLLWNSDMMKIMLYPLSGRFESFFKLSQISNSFPVYLLEIIRIKLDMCCSNLCCSRVSCKTYNQFGDKCNGEKQSGTEEREYVEEGVERGSSFK